MRPRWYVGLKNASRVAFRVNQPPTKENCGYDAVIGPFRTKRAARFMVRCGGNNPHCQTVGDAERLARVEPKVSVVFRVFKEGGDVVALFPGEQADHQGHIQSYQHIGQHAAADYALVMKASRPATPNEYADLEDELERIGYNLKVRDRR